MVKHKKEKPTTQADVHKYYGKSQDKQLEFSMGENLYLFVTVSGSCIFKYRSNFKGRLSWVSLGHYYGKDETGKLLGVTLADARVRAIKFNQNIKDGVNPKDEIEKEIKKGFTVSELVELYCREQLHLRRNNENSRKQFIRAVNSDIVSKIGSYLVVNLDDDLLRQKVIQPKVADGSPASARRARTNLKIVLDYAVEELKLIKFNPVLSIKADRIYQDRPRARYLTLTELGEYLNLVYSSPIKTKFKIAVHLIALLLPRKMELLGATWEQVSFEDKTFIIKNSKMGGDLLIKLPWQALELFKIMKGLSEDSEFIFPSRNSLNKALSFSTLNYILRPLFINTSFSDVVIHDMRRTGASILGEFGYPIEVIEAALNHSKKGIQRVYHRSSYVEQRLEMLQNYADKIDNMLNDHYLFYNIK